jgi:xanthine dehydrogenase D subunit
MSTDMIPAVGGSGTVTRTHSGQQIGVSAARPDGIPKVKGEFEFSSDLHAEGMLWAHIHRSPHASARIVSIDASAAWAIAGVHSVITQADVPAEGHFGMEHQDQPVFAHDFVRYYGEAIAAVAADHPETARLASAAIVVEYEVLDPLVDAEAALTAPPVHPDGNVFRHLVIRHGDQDIQGEVQVEGVYEVGMQDQAFMGPESGLAIPDVDGLGVELHISTQWLHSDLWQVEKCLGLEPGRVRLALAGVGGAFGAREDVSMHVHLCMLALKTGRPIKIVYSRLESFLGHVHRHPATMWYRHHADRDGKLVRVEARLMFDGGAYMSSSGAVLANAACFAAGPYNVPNATIEGYAVRTNNPTCGAMRGFGAVQTCYGHEGQMDRLAAALGMDGLELRRRNALERGTTLITGQTIDGTSPVRELIDGLATIPLPPDTRAYDDMMARPGGAGRTADATHVRRGVGWAIGWKNLMFSEGFDDYSTASCTVVDGAISVKTACAEVGQGFVTVAQQFARTVFDLPAGADDITLERADTAIGSAGSTSASRQTWMSGTAVKEACEAVRAQIFASVALSFGVHADALAMRAGRIVSMNGDVDVALADAAPGRRFYELIEYHHRPTVRLDDNGQGFGHVSWAFAAHRAVVDVDLDLGLIRVVEIATTQDTGTIINPLQLRGQLEGGIAQGVGLAVMEEIVLDRGRVRNPSFTDYLIPTALDMPDVRIGYLHTEPEPGAPYGAKGVGEPPTISSTAAVAAAIRAATGLELPRVPVRPQDIALARRSGAV